MNCPIRQFEFPYKGIFPVSAALSFPDLSRHSFSSQTDSVDSDAEVILNLLALALELHCFSGHSCPFRGGGAFRLALPGYALFWVSGLVSFPDFTTHISIRHSFFPVPADSWPAQQIALGHHSRPTPTTRRACSATPRWQLALPRQRTVPFSSTCFLISGKVRTFAAGKF